MITMERESNVHNQANNHDRSDNAEDVLNVDRLHLVVLIINLP